MEPNKINAAALFVQPSETLRRTVGRNLSSEYYKFECKIIEIIAQINTDFNNYKYTVYRCASKFIALQKQLFTAEIINLKLVLAVLNRHGIAEAEPNLMVPPFQLTSLIRDIYFASEQLGNFSNIPEYNLETATGVLANFFWNIFDPHRRHSISLLEVKVTFILLCKLPNNDELVYEFYKLICNRKTKCVSKLNFEYLLNIFTKILSYVGEENAYGAQNIPKVLEQSFARCHSPMGLTEQQFFNLWTTSETRFLIYANLIVTIKRMEQTKKLIHNNACASCGVEKIVGIRFKCKNCKNLSLCLKCFACGYANGRHETKHRVLEMFNEDRPPKKLSHYFAKLCNYLFMAPNNAEREESTSFCNANEVNTVNETELVTIMPNTTEIMTPAIIKCNTQGNGILNHGSNKLEPSLVGLAATATNASNVSVRLQSIIDRVLVQNFKIEQYLKLVPTATPEQISEFLKAHQQFLTDIIKEMRAFKLPAYSQGSIYPPTSTPYNSVCLSSDMRNRTGAAPHSPMDNSVTTSNLTHSINGAEINRSYLEANRSDYSTKDVSIWFNQHKIPPKTLFVKPLSQIGTETDCPLSSSLTPIEIRETEMTNFRLLLHKVKEIVEDSYSDNTDLAAATQNLENVLDCIIKCEETRRNSLDAVV